MNKASPEDIKQLKDDLAAAQKKIKEMNEEQLQDVYAVVDAWICLHSSMPA